MKKLIVFALTALILSACSTDNAETETTDDSLTGIELTTQVEGTFRGFDGENKVKIERNGKIETIEVQGEVVGDLDKVKEGDNIAFSTKVVNGKTVLETLRLN
ncbi:putative periplasmic lipoprotein [Sutcliffiella deserti]|uniref:membrane lipoprotein lipid attachment site-containing protein n=1 Tax=Sutcliffiella deserti TaxID=2875501 RepID=UPI001CBD957D|nr:membrane lipoprotein lipid attachment site-containing protein [Sutcliffiella deserti]